MQFFLSDLIRLLIQTIHTPYAVLDLQFSPNETDLLAVATSVGSICFFKIVNDPRKTPNLVEFPGIEIAKASTLVLSLAWLPSAYEVGWIAASLSDGGDVHL